MTDKSNTVQDKYELTTYTQALYLHACEEAAKNKHVLASFPNDRVLRIFTTFMYLVYRPKYNVGDTIDKDKIVGLQRILKFCAGEQNAYQFSPIELATARMERELFPQDLALLKANFDALIEDNKK